MEKAKLNVAFDEKSFPKEFLEYLGLRFDITVIDETSEEKPDLLIFTDGEEINPENYGDSDILKTTKIDLERDKRSSDFYFKYRNTPRVGFGRGAHFLTMMMGGFIIQHVENHDKPHYITVENFGNLNIESNHKQMMYPFRMKEDRYQIIAWTKNFRSDTYLKGNGEEMELTSNFLEVEIVKYDKNVLCIQGNPQIDPNEDFKTITLLLIESLIKKVNTTNLKEEDKYAWGNNGRYSEEDFRPKVEEYQQITEKLPHWMGVEKRNIASGLLAKQLLRRETSSRGLTSFSYMQKVVTEKKSSKEHSGFQDFYGSSNSEKNNIEKKEKID